MFYIHDLNQKENHPMVDENKGVPLQKIEKVQLTACSTGVQKAVTLFLEVIERKAKESTNKVDDVLVAILKFLFA